MSVGHILAEKCNHNARSTARGGQKKLSQIPQLLTNCISRQRERSSSRSATMKAIHSLVITFICGMPMTSLFAAAADEAAKAAPDGDESFLRQLIRGRSAFDNTVDTGDVEDADRKLGRYRKYYNEDGGGGGSKGSRGGSGSKGSKGGSGGSGGSGSSGGSGGSGSKGSKGGSTSFNGGGGGGGGGDRHCGAGCGDKDFAYIHLEADYLPMETAGILTQTIQGSTIQILQENLSGTAEYFYHYDDHPYTNEISGIITGSCTILDFFPSDNFPLGTAATLLAHCTFCITYKGECCEEPDYLYEGASDLSPWEDYEKSCTHLGGFATVAGDLFFDLAAASDGTLIPFQNGGLLQLTGLGAVTGTTGDLGPSTNGGIALIEYVADDPIYKIGLQVPFSDSASCKLQDYTAEYLGI